MSGRTRDRSRRLPAAFAAGAVAFLVAACSVAETPSPEATPSASPIYCQDGPNAPTPMPPDCVIPGELDQDTPAPTVPSQPTATATSLPAPAQAMPTLPAAVPWHGKVFYQAADAGTRVIGVGPDDTVYVLAERALATPTAPPSAAFWVPDVKATVVALRPDGSPRPDWPSGGAPVAGFPLDYTVAADGTVYVASGPNIFRANGVSLYQLTISAIGPGGKNLPGWPYRTASAAFGYATQLLVPGPDGTLCYSSHKPGVANPTAETPGELSCLGRDGKLLPGWPYEGRYMFANRPAVGPDGTVYVAEITSTKASEKWPYAYPHELIALGRDGKPRPGWQPWSSSDGDPIGTVLPRPNGEVYVLLGGDGGQARLVVLDANGKQLDDQVEGAGVYNYPEYKDAKLAQSGALYVAVIQESPSGAMIKAYAPDGSVMAGWPQPADHWPTVAVSPDGWVWAVWVVYGVDGAHDTSVEVLFDSQGRLQPGYPMASDPLVLLYGMGLYVDSNGTAYSTAVTKSGSAVVAFSR